MTKEEWPQSRDRLLEDIDKFARKPTVGAADNPVPEPRPASPASPAATQPAASPVAPPRPAVTSAATPTPPPAAPVGTQSVLLSALRQQALAKQHSENQKTSQRDEILQRIHSALGMAFQYLNDLVQQLNILKPPYAKAYSYFGVAEFDEMAWQEGRADFRMQEVSSDNRLYDQVTLRYRLAGPKQFRVERENPALEKLRKALFDYGIAFTADEQRNERNQVERATFSFPCEIKAGLLLAANYESGKLLLRTRNIERFGIMEYQLLPEAINQEALDELARLILGENNRVGQLFQRTA